VAGEFAQFDFGEVDARVLDGTTKRVHFAAYRLKYSRWTWVVPVPDERVESLIRPLLLCFEHSGGVPLRVVFDNPKTVVVRRDPDGRPIWNQTLAQVAIDYGFTIEL
jgi:transposase